MNILKGLLVVLTLVVPNTLYAETMGTTKGKKNNHIFGKWRHMNWPF